MTRRVFAVIGLKPSAVAVALAAGMRAASAVHADVRPAAPFTDNMVLQRGVPIPAWGTADPGEAVRVSFAGAPIRRP